MALRLKANRKFDAPRDGFQVRRNFSSGHVSATSMKTIYGVIAETQIQIWNGSTGRRLTSGGF